LSGRHSTSDSHIKLAGEELQQEPNIKITMQKDLIVVRVLMGERS
jgi:hypothetical protein